MDISLLKPAGICMLIYLVGINVIAFVLYGIDKWKAKRSKWRVSEAALIWMAVLGGSIGALLGMKVWHHKTQHKKFQYGLPFILLLQIALMAWCVWHFFAYTPYGK